VSSWQSTIPHIKLYKHHNVLSSHWVTETIAGAIIRFYHINSNENPADILSSRHWGYKQIWKLLQPLLLKRRYQGHWCARSLQGTFWFCHRFLTKGEWHYHTVLCTKRKIKTKELHSPHYYSCQIGLIQWWWIVTAVDQTMQQWHMWGIL